MEHKLLAACEEARDALLRLCHHSAVAASDIRAVIEEAGPALKIDTAGVRQALLTLLNDIFEPDEIFHIGLWLTPERHWIVARMDDGQDGWTVLGTGTAEDDGTWDSTADVAMHVLGQMFHNKEPFKAHRVEIV